MRRRHMLAGSFLASFASALVAYAQPTADETQLRERLRAYQQAWNRHDIKLWSGFLTDDIWFTEAWDFYGRQKGRENALNLFKSNFIESDLTQQIVKIRMMPDGTATVAMKEVVSHLPKTGGKYKAVFESDPVISRWRKEGEVWKMFFYTSHKGWALDQLKKDGVQ
jgi:ketosteroid isomerase-like protein